MSRLEYGNIIEESQAEIARALGVDRSRVTEAFKQLRHRDVVFPIESRRGAPHMLNPLLVHRGNARALEEPQKKWTEAVQRSIDQP